MIDESNSMWQKQIEESIRKFHERIKELESHHQVFLLNTEKLDSLIRRFNCIIPFKSNTPIEEENSNMMMMIPETLFDYLLKENKKLRKDLKEKEEYSELLKKYNELNDKLNAMLKEKKEDNEECLKYYGNACL